MYHKNNYYIKSKRIFYRALIESHLRYANVIWGSIPSSKIKILQNLQDRARTIIERARIKDDWPYNRLNIEQVIKFDRSAMTYKIMNRMCPASLWDKFPHISLHSNYNTRNCKDIQIPRYNLEYLKKRPSVFSSYCMEQHLHQYQRTANLPAVQKEFKNSSKELNKHQTRLPGRAAKYPLTVLKLIPYIMYCIDCNS